MQSGFDLILFHESTNQPDEPIKGCLEDGETGFHAVVIFTGTPDMKKGRILIAEDDLSHRENLTELLVACGYEVHAVADGRQGLNAFIEDKYDLVITE